MIIADHINQTGPQNSKLQVSIKRAGAKALIQGDIYEALSRLKIFRLLFESAKLGGVVNFQESYEISINLSRYFGVIRVRLFFPDFKNIPS